MTTEPSLSVAQIFGATDYGSKFNQMVIKRLGDLAFRFTERNPGTNAETYLNSIWSAIANDFRVSGERILSEICSMATSDRDRQYPDWARSIAESFLAEAVQTARFGDAAKAWYLLNAASFWCGVLQGSFGAELLAEQAVDRIRRSEAGQGGAKKRERSEIVRRQAFRLAEIHKPKSGWNSPRDAGHRLAPELREFCRTQDFPESFAAGDRFPDTVASYFQELPPEAFARLFPRSTQRSRPRDER